MTNDGAKLLKIERTRKVNFSFDGIALQGHEGESIAAALLRAGILTIRNAPNTGTPRGVFCAMGVCQECVVKIDGKHIEGCRTPLSEGLTVEKVSYE